MNIVDSPQHPRLVKVLKVEFHPGPSISRNYHVALGQTISEPLRRNFLVEDNEIDYVKLQNYRYIMKYNNNNDNNFQRGPC